MRDSGTRPRVIPGVLAGPDGGPVGSFFWPERCERCGRHYLQVRFGWDGMRRFSLDLRKRWCNDEADCEAAVRGFEARLRRNGFRLIDGGLAKAG